MRGLSNLIAKGAFLAVALAIGTAACERLWDWSLGPGENLDATLAGLSRADRLLIKDRARDEIKRRTSDPAEIADVTRFFRRYPDHWVMFSGAGGDYDLFFYTDDRLIGRVGLTSTSRVRPKEDTLNVGDYFRRVPRSEVAEVARRLGLV